MLHYKRKFLVLKFWVMLNFEFDLKKGEIYLELQTYRKTNFNCILMRKSKIRHVRKFSCITDFIVKCLTFFISISMFNYYFCLTFSQMHYFVFLGEIVDTILTIRDLEMKQFRSKSITKIRNCTN